MLCGSKTLTSVSRDFKWTDINEKISLCYFLYSIASTVLAQNYTLSKDYSVDDVSWENGRIGSLWNNVVK